MPLGDFPTVPKKAEIHMSDLRETSEHCLDEDTRILRDCEIERVRGGWGVQIPVFQKVRDGTIVGITLPLAPALTALP